MTMPNFIVIGASRSGTTALYHYLDQHPQVYMCPVKEPGLFAREEKPSPAGPNYELIKRLIRRSAISARIADLETYRALFQGVSNQKAIGEASPAYLFDPKAPERIARYIPGASLVAILRDPVERAYSDYISGVVNGYLPPGSFAQELRGFLKDRDWRSQGRRYRYVGIGFYYCHLRRYLDTFDRSQIKVYLYEDFRANPVAVLRNVFRFLGIDETFVPDMSIKYGVTGVPKNRALETVLRKLRKSPIKAVLRPLLPISLRRRINKLGISNLVRPPLAPEVRREWVQIYREDILQLQELIQRDLSSWLE